MAPLPAGALPPADGPEPILNRVRFLIPCCFDLLQRFSPHAFFYAHV